MRTEVYPKVAFVILDHNAGPVLRDCLASVFRQNYPDFEVILADNASTDQSFAEARERFPEAIFLPHGRNLGFAAGNNPAIRMALDRGADFIFLLNPDALLEKQTLSLLISAARKNPGAGALSPLILEEDGRSVWFAGGAIHWLRMRTVHRRKPLSSTGPYPTDYLSGCAMLIRKEALRKTGPLDEAFFLYYEDADLSLRLRQDGYSLLVVPPARVTHLERSEQQKERKAYWLVLSGLIFFRKHSSSFRRSLQLPLYILRRLKNRLRLIGRPSALARNIERAYNDYALWKTKLPASRS